MITFIQKPRIDSFRIELLTTRSLKDSNHAESLNSLGFEGEYGSACILPSQKIIAVGASLKAKTKTNDPYFKVDPFELGAAITRCIEKTQISALHIESIDLLVELTQQTPYFVLRQFLLGIAQGRWDFDTYKKKKVTTVEVSIGEQFDDGEISNFSDILSSVRMLVEETPEKINPESFQTYILQSFKSAHKVKVNVLDERELQKIGMNGVLAVGRAGAYKPRVIHAIYTPNAAIKQRICLVGKGVTYDSGGLDIKTGGFMKGMKMDMGGAATMYGVFKQISEIGLEHTEVHYITGLVENMISPDSMKPDDIYTSYSGLTVEIGNTDAEGRITLGDLLTYATEQQPDFIIDAATLTGASLRALTEYNGTLVGNDKMLNQSLVSSFQEHNERLIDEPMGEFLRERMVGNKSDLQNIQNPPHHAGHITAAVFLSNFVEPSLFRNENIKTHDRKEGYAWAHIDLAGPVYNDKKNALKYDGATGYAVRSLVDWVQKADNES